MARKIVTKDPPDVCDICKKPVTTEFVDGATAFGSWADMCMMCFGAIGAGLGQGRGQQYREPPDGSKPWVKIAG